MPDQAPPSADDFLKQFAAPAASGPAPSQSADDFLSAYAPNANTGAIPVKTSASAAKPQTGVGRLLAGAGSALVKGLDVGLGLPGDLEALGVQYIANPLAHLTGIGKEEPDPWAVGPAGTIFPTSRDLLDITGRAGLTDRADLIPGQPENFLTHPGTALAERYGAAALQGLGSAAPQAALGPLGATVSTLAAGAAGSAAGQGANELFPDSKLAPIAAGTVAGTGIQALAGAFAGSQVAKVARALGPAQTLQEAGETLQDGARDWISNKLPVKLAEAWAPLHAAVPDTVATPLINYAARLKSLMSKGGILQPSIGRMAGKLPEDLQKLLNQGQSLAGLTGVSAIPTWGNVSDFSTALGEALHNPIILKQIPEKQLSSLYQALQDDRRAVTQALDTANPGLGATAKLAFANTESQRLYGIAEGPMAKVVAGPKANSEDKAPEKVAKTLLGSGKAGGTDIAALRAELPEAVDNLAAAHLRTNSADWLKLSPEGKAALVPYAPMRNVLDKAVPVKLPVFNKELNALHSLSTSLLGALAGHGLAGTVPNLLMPELIGAAGGIGLPLLWRGAKALAKNPNLLAGPVAGTVGGANALFPNPAENSR